MAVFDLKLASGKVVRWEGQSGEDAARRYVDTFRGETVIAWRVPPQGLRIGLHSGNIVD